MSDNKLSDVFDDCGGVEFNICTVSEKCRVCGRDTDGKICVDGIGCVCADCGGRIARQMNKRKKEYEREIEKEKGSSVLSDIYVPSPMELFDKLSEYIIGQENVKRVLSVAAYNHYKRIGLKNDGIQKSNVLILGPTGSGKTYIVDTLAKILGVPVAKVSATTLTEAGYIGNDIETCIEKLYKNAGKDIEKTQHGIVFIDEIDKLSDNGYTDNGKATVGRTGVQQALLTMIEGSDVEVDSKMSKMYGGLGSATINTKNILFIFGGAFVGIEGVVRKRLAKETNTGIGFGYTVSEEKSDIELIKRVEASDLIEYGMLAEFVGRVPGMAICDELTPEFLLKALTKPKNNLLWQYQELMRYDGVELIVEDDALRVIADDAFSQGVGCRGLRRVCEKVFLELMYSVPNSGCDRVVVTKDYIQGNAKLIVEKNPIIVGIQA